MFNHLNSQHFKLNHKHSSADIYRFAIYGTQRIYATHRVCKLVRKKYRYERSHSPVLMFENIFRSEF